MCDLSRLSSALGTASTLDSHGDNPQHTFLHGLASSSDLPSLDSGFGIALTT